MTAECDRRLVEATERGAEALVQIAAVLAVLIDLALVSATAVDGPCPHPEDERVNMSTMGRMCWRCKRCGHTVGFTAEQARTDGGT